MILLNAALLILNITWMALSITHGIYWLLPISGFAGMWCLLHLFKQLNELVEEIKK